MAGRNIGAAQYKQSKRKKANQAKKNAHPRSTSTPQTRAKKSPYPRKTVKRGRVKQPSYQDLIGPVKKRLVTSGKSTSGGNTKTYSVTSSTRKKRKR